MQIETQQGLVTGTESDGLLTFLGHAPHVENDPDGPEWRDAYKVEG